MDVPLQPTLNLASAVPLVVLGAALLALRWQRSQQLMLGLFAFLWGCQIAAANLARFNQDPLVGRGFSLVVFALAPLLSLCLARFVALVHGGRWSKLLPALAAVAALPAWAILLLRPELAVSVVVQNGQRALTYGPAAAPLFIMPFHATFVLSLLVAYLRYRRDPAGSLRHRSRGLVMALALFLSHMVVYYAFVFIDPAAVNVGGATLWLSAFYAAIALVVAAVGIHVMARPPAPERLDWALAAAFVVPAAFGVLGGILVQQGIDFVTLGLWRMASVAILVATVVRYDLFDMETRLRRNAGILLAAVALVGATLAVLAALLGGQSPGQVATLSLGGASLTGLFWVGNPVLAHILRNRSGPDPNYLYQRKLDVYGASLMQLAGDPASQEVLERLRESLNIRPEDANRLTMQASAAARGTRPAGAGTGPLAAGDVMAGRYRLERLLGEGAHGRAFAATDQQTGSTVVVKVVGTMAHGGRAAELLLREGRLAGGLAHPNIVAVLGVVHEAREAAVVLEFVDGGTLQGFLERRRLDVYRAASLLDQILAGLAAAHALGIIHRDVKPENVLLTRAGQAKLTDFGVAQDVRPDATAGFEHLPGTLLYMSPEQVRGGPVDARSDLYSAAVVFYQMLTGRYYLAITGADDFQIRRAILEQAPRLPLPDQPDWVNRLLARALAKNPTARHADAAAMRHDLEAIGIHSQGQGFYPLEALAAA